MALSFQRLKPVALFIFAILLLPACELPGKKTLVSVRGRVVDTAGDALSEAVVSFDASPPAVHAAADGTFKALLWSGEHRMAVWFHGAQMYDQQVTIPAGREYDFGDIRPDSAFFQSRLVVRAQGQYDYRYDYQQWCAVSVADSAGMAVAGLGYDDFEITEAFVRTTDGQVIVQGVIPLAEQSQSKAYDLGLFERSVTSEKLDIVFLTDGTGSFDDDGTDVRGEVKRLVEKLTAEHIDFRIAGISFDETPDSPPNFEFYGPEEADRIPDAIDSVLRTAGDGWDPTCAYDALLFTDYFGFRPDARRVAVILTDIIPQTVYGTFWYSIDASIATRSAAEIFLEDHGIELFYAVFEHHAPDIEYYCQPDKNPRAGETGNVRYGIEGSGLSQLRLPGGKEAIQLTWPFTADELWEKLDLNQSPLKDSWYMMTWFPVIDSDDLTGSREQYRYRISIAVRDSQTTGAVLTVSYDKPLIHPTTTAEIQLVDEEGNPFREAWSWLYVDRGGRATDHIYHQVGPDETGTLVFKDIVPQHYELLVTDGSPLPHGFANLRAIARLNFEVPADGTHLQLTVRTAERAADEAVLRGLLHDLNNWRLSGAPYRNIINDIHDWLYGGDGTDAGMLCNGMNWREQAALRHVNLVLGGYANLNEYSQLEAQRAVEDFQSIVSEIGLLADEIESLQQSTSKSWGEALASAGFRAALDLATAGQAEVLISTVEALLSKLIDYLTDAFFDELVDLLQEKIIEAAGIDPEHPVCVMVDAGVALYKRWDSSGSGQNGNLEVIWEIAQKLSVNLFLDALRDTVAETTLQETFDALRPQNATEKDVKRPVRELVKILWSGTQLRDFDERLQGWATATGGMLSSHTREDIVTATGNIFDRWGSELEQRGVAENFNDFVLGFFRDMAVMTVPKLANGTVVSSLARDDAITILLKHAVYNVFLRDRFVDGFQAALADTLARAKVIAATPAADFDRWEWRGRTYHTLFRNFRSAIGSAQDTAWDALEKQRDIHLWAEGLSGLQAILRPLGDALDVAAVVYYPLQDAADAVHAFYATLDGIQIVVTAVEFGLKLRGLEDFGSLSRTVYLQAFE